MLKKLRKALLNSALAFACILGNSAYSKEVNNCLIRDSDAKSVQILTDQEKPNGSYVLFNKGVLANSQDSAVDIQFKPGNPYLEIEDSDLVRIKLQEGSGFRLEKRVNNIPLLSINGNYKIFQGSRAVKNLDGIITIENPTDSEPEYEKDYEETKKKQGFAGSYRHTSSPLEIIFTNPQDVFFDGRKACEFKIIFDNFNRMGIIPIKNKEGIDIYENIPITFSSKLNRSLVTKEEVEKITGIKINIDDSIEKGVRNLVLGRLRDYWKFTPETSRKFLKEIDFQREVKLGNLPYAGATYFSGNIFLNAHSFRYGIHRHECAHGTHFHIIKEYLAKIGKEDLVKRIDQNYSRYFELSKNPRTFTVSNGRRSSYTYIDNGSRNHSSARKLLEYARGIPCDFETEWMKIAGEYDKTITYEKDGINLYEYLCDHELDDKERNKLFSKFKGDKYEALWRPCFGYTTAYGGTDKEEDIATLTQMIASEPKHFRDIEDKSWIPLYLQKAKTLNDNGFFIDREYKCFLDAIGKN